MTAPYPPDKGSHPPQTTETTPWLKLLNSQSRWVGHWLKIFALMQIDAAAQRGNRSAARQLANILIANHPTEIQTIARDLLLKTTRQGCIDELWYIWSLNRSPQLFSILKEINKAALKPVETRCLSLLKLNRLASFKNIDPEYIEPLITFLSDLDSDVARSAVQAFGRIQNTATQDAICDYWAVHRHPALMQIIQKYAIQASDASPNKSLVRLLLDQDRSPVNFQPDEVPVLLKIFTSDPDLEIRSTAHKALLKLTNPQAQDSVCREFLENNNADALQIALQAKYIPQNINDQILFYFLSNQWEAYEDLDFDHRILHTLLGTVSPALRGKIVRAVQQSGNARYLEILTGPDLHASRNYTDDEARTLLEMLTMNQDWSKIWNLTFELPARWSLECVRVLVAQHWQSSLENQLILNQLSPFLSLKLEFNKEALRAAIPLALPRSNIKLNSRVNSISFSPNQPVIAIGLGGKKVVLWNYQNASTEKIINGFEHSIGEVCFRPNGSFVCAERSNQAVPCGIYLWDANSLKLLGKHQGSVTALYLSGPDTAISTGKDQLIQKWDLAQLRIEKSKKTSSWYRSVCLTPDQHKAALLTNMPFLCNLEQLSLIPLYIQQEEFSSNYLGVARSACFSPDGNDLWVGQNNGKIVRYADVFGKEPIKKFKAISSHPKSVEGIFYLPDHPLLITAGAEGDIRFMNTLNNVSLGSVSHEQGRLTSLHISNHGEFMASGTSEASFMLWDLRGIDLLYAISASLSQSSPACLAIIASLLETGKISEDIRNTLLFYQALVKYRFRYDVQISDTVTLQAGQFDILIDG